MLQESESSVGGRDIHQNDEASPIQKIDSELSSGMSNMSLNSKPPSDTTEKKGTASTKDTSSQKKAGWFGGMLNWLPKRENQAILPDDKNPTVSFCCTIPIIATF